MENLEIKEVEEIESCDDCGWEDCDCVPEEFLRYERESLNRRKYGTGVA